MTLWSVVVIHLTTVAPLATRRVGAPSAVRSIVDSVAALIVSSLRWTGRGPAGWA